MVVQGQGSGVQTTAVSPGGSPAHFVRGGDDSAYHTGLWEGLGSAPGNR